MESKMVPMGAFYFRKDRNTWYITYQLNGKRIRKAVGKDKKTAELLLKDIEVKIAKNNIGFEAFNGHSDKIDSFIKEYLKYIKTNFREETYIKYKSVCNIIWPYFSKRNITKLFQLSPAIFEDFKRERKSTVTTTTINNNIRMMKSMLNMAIRWGYIKESPLKDTKYLEVTDSVPIRILTKEEIETFLKNCPPRYYPIFYTFLTTAIRKGELCNLEWADIDMEKKIIYIRKKKDFLPKSKERQIPINPRLYEILQKLPKTSNYVFPDSNNKRYPKNKLRRKMIKIAKISGIKGLTRLHSLRHTTASHLVMKGVDLPTIQKLLGHANIKTTMIYAHITDSHLKDSIDKLTY